MPFADPDPQLAAVVAIHRGLQSLQATEAATRLLDRVQGETDLFALLDQLVGQVARDSAAVEAIDGQIEALTARKGRLVKRVTSARAVLEQALLAAALPTLKRPLATLQLVRGPATVEIGRASAIPAQYWRPGKPVLDTRRLIKDLTARRATLEALLTTPAAGRARALAVFQRRFLGEAEAQALRARLAGLDACDSPGARAVALAALRRDFVSFPGVRLAGDVPTLAIQLRRPPDRRGPGGPL
jgi:hypothetical protein